MALEIVSELSLLRDPSHQTISERTDFLCPGRDGIEGLDVLAGMHVLDGTTGLLVRSADGEGQPFG